MKQAISYLLIIILIAGGTFVLGQKSKPQPKQVQTNQQQQPKLYYVFLTKEGWELMKLMVRNYPAAANVHEEIIGAIENSIRVQDSIANKQRVDSTSNKPK